MLSVIKKFSVLSMLVIFLLAAVYMTHLAQCESGWPSSQLLSCLGQERFGNMTRVYYKEAVGCFIVFDLTRLSTFEAVERWKKDLDSKVSLPDGSRIPCVLLANKVCLPKCLL